MMNFNISFHAFETEPPNIDGTYLVFCKFENEPYNVDNEIYSYTGFSTGLFIKNYNRFWVNSRDNCIKVLGWAELPDAALLHHLLS